MVPYQFSSPHVWSRGVVGLFGFNSDRRLALKALAVAATKDDVHAVFAGSIFMPMVTPKYLTHVLTRLALMTYHGSVLLLARSLIPSFPNGLSNILV